MFDIFDLAFPKIVDPTIFVRDLFCLARFARDFFSAREFPSSVAASPRSRKSPPVPAKTSSNQPSSTPSRPKIVIQTAYKRLDRREYFNRSCVASREGRRGGGDGSLLASRRVKEGENAAMDRIS